ncbi:MAG: leucyl aminopeptidase family protein [Pseudomonadota bacterium]
MNVDLICPFDANRYSAARQVFVTRSGDALDDVPGSLKELARLNNFKGELGAVLVGVDGVLIGIGSGDDPFAIAAASEKLPDGDYRIDGEVTEQSLFAWLLGGYRFNRYKSHSKPFDPNDHDESGTNELPPSPCLIAPDGLDVTHACRVAEAVGLTRDLVNTPASDMLPDMLEAEARAVADEFEADVKVITGNALLKQNFPLIHTVGRASAVEPRLIEFTWGSPKAPKLTLVGKGVCFDTGGLNLKPGNSMALMKKDMGGAANTLGLARLIMSSRLNVRLRVLIPAVENAVSGASFRPGDVLSSRKGLSVEIGNTDAEGRLVLADTMEYGGEDHPDIMVTLATLTGAARIALGPEVPPVYCDDEDFVGQLLSNAEKEADPIWRMPLWKPYDKMLSSPIADINNAPATGFAGSITAALFLKRFQPKDVTWAHFDMYAWRPNAAPGRPVGGEAQAIRALFRTFSDRFGHSGN